MGGVSDDFEGKNCYDLFPPSMAKKFHEDDLTSITTNTSMMNIIEPYQPHHRPNKLMSTNKIPIIHPETNKKMILVIAQVVDNHHCN